MKWFHALMTVLIFIWLSGATFGLIFLAGWNR